MTSLLVKHKKFRRYPINNCYPVAIDGTQKLTSARLWSDELLARKKTAPFISLAAD